MLLFVNLYFAGGPRTTAECDFDYLSSSILVADRGPQQNAITLLYLVYRGHRVGAGAYIKAHTRCVISSVTLLKTPVAPL
jgi:hypothetical protein